LCITKYPTKENRCDDILDNPFPKIVFPQINPYLARVLGHVAASLLDRRFCFYHDGTSRRYEDETTWQRLRPEQFRNHQCDHMASLMGQMFPGPSSAGVGISRAGVGLLYLGGGRNLPLLSLPSLSFEYMLSIAGARRLPTIS